MFNKASAFLGVYPENILHVGDSLENDVMGAVNAGFKAGWYADDREMNIASEKAYCLPDVEFSSLQEMVSLLCA